MFLVDSSVWIDFLNGNSTSQSDYLSDHIEECNFLVGDLILTEVLQGTASEAEFNQILRLLSKADQLTIVDHTSAIQAARNFKTLRTLGITVRKTIDTLIATRCISDGIALLYSDRDFDPFVEHLGLASALAKGA
jgi:predicted nucleic acid-binding protein